MKSLIDLQKYNRVRVENIRNYLKQYLDEVISRPSGQVIVLEKVLGTSAEMWVRIQAEYDLWVAREKAA